MTTILQNQPEAPLASTPVASAPSMSTFKMVCDAMPQTVLATDGATMVMKDGAQVVLPPLTQLNLVKLLNAKLESLSVSGRKLTRKFGRGFNKASMGNLTCLLLTDNALHADTRGSRLVLSKLPASIQHLTLSWNDLNSESADVLARQIIFMKQLKSVCLAGNPIGMRGLQRLIDFGNLHHVEELDLRQCNLGANGAAMLGKIMSNPEAKTQRIFLDMNLLAAFSRAVDTSKVQLKVQLDMVEKVAFLKIKRAD